MQSHGLVETVLACLLLASLGCSSLGITPAIPGTSQSEPHSVESTADSGGSSDTDKPASAPMPRIEVLGEVNSPGSYPLPVEATVLDALLAAGGPANSAQRCTVTLSRLDRSPATQAEGSQLTRFTKEVCYREITHRNDAATNYRLQSGDRIFVAPQSGENGSDGCPAKSGCVCGKLDPRFDSHRIAWRQDRPMTSVGEKGVKRATARLPSTTGSSSSSDVSGRFEPLLATRPAAEH